MIEPSVFTAMSAELSNTFRGWETDHSSQEIPFYLRPGKGDKDSGKTASNTPRAVWLDGP